MASTIGLAEPFKSRVEQLLLAAGGKVTLTSGRRTYAEQAALRIRNGCPDVYTSPASSCDVPTARPGTSKHESGLAADFGGDLTLASKLAAQVGLKRTVTGEPWHFEPAEAKGAGGDTGTTGWPWQLVNGVAAVGAADPDDEGLVEGFVRGLRNLTVTGLILAGAAALVVMGGYRAVTGRSLAADTTKAASQGALMATTGGTGTAVKSGATRKAAAS